MSNIKICVAIPVYNHRKRLDSIIESLPADISVLVVDDGSMPPISLTSKRAELLRFEKNHGKAEALKEAFRYSANLGFTHVITLDADGQHPPSLVADFMKEAKANPESIILGVRDFDNSSIPPARKFMNRFSNFWFWTETGKRVDDTQCGFRCYPISKISKLKMNFGGFVFETEILVKAAWAGVSINQIQIPAIYDDETLSGSHYRPFVDTFRFTLMNTRLFFTSLFCPRNVLKKIALKK